MAKLNYHPMQQIIDVNGVIRFRQNKIVRHLLDAATKAGIADLNKLEIMDFSREDRMQLAQLIGYSVSGYGDLGYPSKESVAEADAKADEIIARKRPVPRFPRITPAG